MPATELSWWREPRGLLPEAQWRPGPLEPRWLPEPLARFYESLAAAEARHAGLYLRLAARAGEPVAARLEELAVAEAELATTPDGEFRFHSGTPA